ncbi:acyl carrier protein [Streptomyces sp. NPDC050504]|uniref:acyl carrier protein n=1 Tax=Streptomyces sp. NPDC050504 TaxID=3365618 RepID=UPI00378DB4ED
MNSTEVRAVLLEAVRDLRPELADLPLTGDEHLGSELGVDSVGRVELLISVEEAFDIEGEVDPRIFMTPPTVNDLVKQIVVTEAART